MTRREISERARQRRELRAIEASRKRRYKFPVRYCPCCGLPPEIPWDQTGKIFRGECARCQVAFDIHVCD